MQSLADAGINTVNLDATDDASMKACVGEAVRKSGCTDVLVNNAGFGSYGAIEDDPMDEARRQFEVNVFGAMRMAQLVLPSMRERCSGTIVNISSIGGRVAGPLGGWYRGTKFALDALSDTLSLKVNPFGIDVLVIEPGAVRTEFTEVAVDALVAASGPGPDGQLTKAIIKSMASEDLERRKAPPTVIADSIHRAVIPR